MLDQNETIASNFVAQLVLTWLPFSRHFEKKTYFSVCHMTIIHIYHLLHFSLVVFRWLTQSKRDWLRNHLELCYEIAVERDSVNMKFKVTDTVPTCVSEWFQTGKGKEKLKLIIKSNWIER